MRQGAICATLCDSTAHNHRKTHEAQSIKHVQRFRLVWVCVLHRLNRPLGRATLSVLYHRFVFLIYVFSLYSALCVCFYIVYFCFTLFFGLSMEFIFVFLDSSQPDREVNPNPGNGRMSLLRFFFFFFFFWDLLKEVKSQFTD